MNIKLLFLLIYTLLLLDDFLIQDFVFFTEAASEEGHKGMVVWQKKQKEILKSQCPSTCTKESHDRRTVGTVLPVDEKREWKRVHGHNDIPVDPQTMRKLKDPPRPLSDYKNTFLYK